MGERKSRKVVVDRGRYRKIAVRLWNDFEFLDMSIEGQFAWMFLLTCPQHSPLPGLIFGSRGVLAEASGKPESLSKGFDEVLAKGWAKHDARRRVTWIPNATKYNPPQSPNVVTGWRVPWGEWPDCGLKYEAYQSIKSRVGELGESFSKAFAKAFPKISPNQDRDLDIDRDGDRDSFRGESHEESSPPSPPSPAPSPSAPRLPATEGEYQEQASKLPQPSQAYQLADALRDHVRDVQPTNAAVADNRWKATREAWALELRMASERDGQQPDGTPGRGWDALGRALEWARADSYWGPRLITAKVLRRGFDSMMANASAATRGGGSRKGGGMTAEEIQAHADALRAEGL